MNLYRIAERSTATFREKGSKFISYLIPVNDERQAQTELKYIRSTYPDATHHCYAWRVNPINLYEFSQDDGEPSGTAGLPILGRLRSHELVNILGVVVRYYGGTNLGKGGLIKAYSQGIDITMSDVQRIPLVAGHWVTISYPYSESRLIDHLCTQHQALAQAMNYGASVCGTVFCPDSTLAGFLERLQELEWCGVESKKSERTYYDGATDE